MGIDPTTNRTMSGRSTTGLHLAPVSDSDKGNCSKTLLYSYRSAFRDIAVFTTNVFWVPEMDIVVVTIINSSAFTQHNAYYENKCIFKTCKLTYN